MCRDTPQHPIVDPNGFSNRQQPLFQRHLCFCALGKELFNSDSKGERGFQYQHGIRDEIQDQPGAVLDMYVGETRKFRVPQDLILERGGKIFQQKVPLNVEYIDVEATLVYLQPY